MEMVVETDTVIKKHSKTSILAEFLEVKYEYFKHYFIDYGNF